MDVKKLSPVKRLALSLDAPLCVTATNPEYTAITPETATQKLKNLESWWDIHNKEDLESTLKWLDKEGGHTAVYVNILNKLRHLTYEQRLKAVQQAEKNSTEEGIRFNIAHKYFYDLGPYTIRAFDISRYVLLAKSGCTIGWYSENELWEIITPQAELIIKHQMFSSHTEYLLSHFVGRTFAMCHGSGDIKESLRLINVLMSRPDSPFLSFIDWKEIVSPSAERTVQ